MKICSVSFIYPNPDKAILGSFIHEQLVELAKTDEVYLITRKEPHWKIPRYEIIDNIHIFRINAKNKFTLPIKLFFKILELNKKNKFDVIHAHFTGFFTMFSGFASLLLGKPFFITTYGISLDPKSISFVKRMVIRITFLISKKVISISQYTKKLCQNYASKKKHMVITPGISLSKLKPTITQKNFRKKHNLGKGHILLSIGGLVWRKGFDITIKIMPSIVKKYPDTKLVIIGKGPEEIKLKNLAKGLNLEKNVIFWPNWVSDKDLANFYNACSIFILMNITKGAAVQGFGIVYVEANAMGKPIIGGKGGGISDAIIDGKTGFAINPDNQQLIIKRTLQLLGNKNLREKMGSDGKSYALKTHLWEFKTDQLLQLYSKYTKNNHQKPL
jgi:phosphatidyl-myo-inositol dimannoside synthase